MHKLFGMLNEEKKIELTFQLSQHITLRQSIDGRTVEWQFYFTKYKLYIVTILECRVLFSFSFSLNFVVEDVTCS